jgi:hypothetical protein
LWSAALGGWQVPQALEKLREENQRHPAYGNIGIYRHHPKKILVYI